MSTYNHYQTTKDLDYAGLYLFLNPTTNKFYIGETITSLIKRIRSHLLTGISDNRSFFLDEDTRLYVVYVVPTHEASSDYLKYLEYYFYYHFKKLGYIPLNNQFKNRHKNISNLDDDSKKIIENFNYKDSLNLFTNGLADLKGRAKTEYENRKLQVEIKNFKTEVSMLKAEIKKSKKHANTQHATIEYLELAIDNLNLTIEELDAIIEDLEMTIDNSNATINSLRGSSPHNPPLASIHKIF